jgi:L,D-peptidoglycan transpeptidase YkuD (ErfK/YbiS/YcfS/YnhG family)
MTRRKREGDGKSPVGRWLIQSASFRADRLGFRIPHRGLVPLRPDDGWCDDASHRAYNRPVKLPFAAGHEGLWRDDTAYDVVMVTAHNQRPRQRHGGSAIFFHLIHEGATCTAGCIAVSLADMRKILGIVKGRISLTIG